MASTKYIENVLQNDTIGLYPQLKNAPLQIPTNNDGITCFVITASINVIIGGKTLKNGGMENTLKCIVFESSIFNFGATSDFFTSFSSKILTVNVC